MVDKMHIVKFVSIGGDVLYETKSDDINSIISDLNSALLNLGIDRKTNIQDSFDDLFNNYLTQAVYLENAKLNGVYMAGGRIKDKYIELVYRIENLDRINEN